MLNEIWVDIKGYEGYYQVNNLGDIRSMDRVLIYPDGSKKNKKGILKKYSNLKNGYLLCSLNKNHKTKALLVHTIVAMAFIPNPYNKSQVNHKDGNKKNNKVENLEWVTPSENQLHSFHVLNAPRTFSKPIYCPTLCISFKSRTEASCLLGVEADRISEVCIGRRSHYKGLTFRFLKK